MRIDASITQNQWSTAIASQPSKEVAGERESDGDSDDAVKLAAKPVSAQQINPQGVATKVDLFA